MISQLGAYVLFLQLILVTLRRTPCKWNDFIDQSWKVTVESFFTTSMAGFFVGAIMAVQFAAQVKDFGALGYLGGLATSATVREVGPLLIAFMLCGKVGAYTSAELGTMRVTEQIDAIRCLGANPLQEIILPRFLGIIVASFLLLGSGLVMSVLGGIFLGYFLAGVNPEEYVRHIPTILHFGSVASGLFKAFVFAVVLATICTYQGYYTTGGAKGVGRAVVTTSVVTMISIVGMDWVTSFISSSIGKFLFEVFS